jgi:hypothetical protein
VTPKDFVRMVAAAKVEKQDPVAVIRVWQSYAKKIEASCAADPACPSPLPVSRVEETRPDFLRLARAL